MKKMFYILLIQVLAFGFCGCSKCSEDQQVKSSKKTSETGEEELTPAKELEILRDGRPVHIGPSIDPKDAKRQMQLAREISKLIAEKEAKEISTDTSADTSQKKVIDQ